MATCPCQCHRPAYASWRAALQHETFFQALEWSREPGVNYPTFPDTSDPVAAATACDVCRDAHHCDALLTRRLWDDHAHETPSEPWTDPPPPPITLNPDGD